MGSWQWRFFYTGSFVLKMKSLLQKLEGGDRRSIGKADEVVRLVLKNPALFKEIVEGMYHDNPIIRMRCADAAEKITLKHPEYLIPYKKTLINRISGINQQEVRWHVAQMLPRMELSNEEKNQAIALLHSYLQDKSNIVKTFSLQALTDFAIKDDHLKKMVINGLRDL